LQVLDGTGAAWVDVTVVPGSLLVNLGNQMQRWSNDRWSSTKHRVTNPPAGAGGRRLSIAYFHKANYDAVIDPRVGPDRKCLPRHHPYIRPSFIESFGIT